MIKFSAFFFWACFALVAIWVSGCTPSAEKVNQEMAKQAYDAAHDECWRLFSRIDPERKKEYQACMQEKGWLIK